MDKFFYYFFLVFISHTLIYGQDMDIFLIKSKSQILESSPDYLKIGVTSSHQVYFKLIKGENILKGSQFQTGLNILEIESAGFFQKPSSHLYFLVTKKNFCQKKIRIIFTTRFINTYETSKIPKNNPNSMQIEIPGYKKNIQKNIGPLNPLTHRYDNLESINLFGIISTLIKNKKQKSWQQKLKEIKSRPARCKEMTIGYYPDNAKANQEPVYVSIILNWEKISK